MTASTAAAGDGAGLLAHRLGEGDGEPVLLLNGGMMTFASWAPVVAALGAGRRTLGCDLRGQLLCPGEAHPRLDDNVPDVVALLDALGLERVHALGTSFGGEIALLLAARHPGRVRTLAVVTAADRSPDGMRDDSRALAERAREVIGGGDPGPFHDHVTAEVYSAAWRERHAAELAERRSRSLALPASWYRGLLGILAAIEDFDLRPDLGRIRCPALVVHAGADRVMPAERVEALAAAIPGAELAVHPTSGHALVAEEPEWLGRTYRAWLDRLAPQE